MRQEFSQKEYRWVKKEMAELRNKLKYNLGSGFTSLLYLVVVSNAVYLTQCFHRDIII